MRAGGRPRRASRRFYRRRARRVPGGRLPVKKSSCQNRFRTRIFTRRCTERHATANNAPIEGRGRVPPKVIETPTWALKWRVLTAPPERACTQ
ncbi:hypothetical protein C7S14_6362 [Burkholderia cepacia]|nr:hypothetical protein C7S14_6362 [Burkholderia cepacia]